jgi:hypothetical protein
LSKGEDVLRVIPQCGHFHGDGRKPRVEVRPEALGTNSLGKATAGGRDDAHIDGDGSGRAETLKSMVLEHAQEFQLNPRAHVANLMQKKRSLVGIVKATDAAPLSAGEGRGLVAKKLTLQGSFGKRCAVDND